MPGASGYDLCRHIRGRDSRMPILFITAKGEEIDKVASLELGADDYIVKTFGTHEVLARIRAITRQCIAAPIETCVADRIHGDDFEMDDLRISPRSLPFEFCRRAWEQGHIPGSRTLDQTISQLRKRIEIAPQSPRIIHTAYGVGYRYD